MKPTAQSSNLDVHGAPTDSPGPRGWHIIYLVVLLLFVVWVGLLTALPWLFS